MRHQSPDRLEIFLALAEQSVREPDSASETTAPKLVEETSAASPDEFRSAILDYLSEKESDKFRRLAAAYQSKSESERAEWQEKVLLKIGTDEHLVDDTVHWSYVNEALLKEIPAVREIIFASLPSECRKAINPALDESTKTPSNQRPKVVARTIRRAFAGNFAALRNLPKPTAFDRLSGSQTARLIRLAGIREVALACLQIEAVELVAAFLRRFSTEDAQAVAAQLNSLPKMSEERLEFAENLVKTMVETETEPSAMLDLLGIHLLGSALCSSSEQRVAYANQKLPLEAAPQLSAIIAEQCRLVPSDLQSEISAEIEQTAQTIHRSANGKKPSKS